jgi:hypothetical protein
MRAAATNLAARVGVMAAIFVVTLGGVLIGLHEAAPPEPAALPKVGMPRGLPAAHGARSKTTRAQVNAVREKAKNYRPEQHDQIGKQLRPAIVTIKSPVAVQLGDAGQITLTIKDDAALGNKVAIPALDDSVNPVHTTVAERESVKVYQMQVSNRVTTHLFEASAEHAIAPREADTLSVPRGAPEGTTWTWSVPAAQVGRKALQFVMLAHVDAVPDPYPVGHLAIEMPVEVTGFEWVKYYLGELGTMWNWLAAFAASLVAVTSAIPLVRKWLPIPHARKEAAEAPKVT